LTKCLIYAVENDNANGGYEAQLSLPHEPSSVVRALKVMYFPSNKKGEVSEEEFELLRLHGHIGKGRLELAEGFLHEKRAK